MDNSVEAYIYVAQYHTCLESDKYRISQVINTTSFDNNIASFEDITLAPNYSLTGELGANFLTIWLPMVGGLIFKNKSADDLFIDAGQAFLIIGNSSYEIVNPYATELVNFLQIQVAVSNKIVSQELVRFNLVHKNQLLSMSNACLPIYIGKFDGREESIYQPHNQQSSIFAFVITGAFEVQNRLLEPRDGLLLKNLTTAVEFEALSNEAIILFLEV